MRDSPALSMRRGRASRVEPGGSWPVSRAHLSIGFGWEEQVDGRLRLARFRRGSSGDQSAGRGPCRSNGLLSGEHVPDGLGDLAGNLHPGDSGAALPTKPLLGALVVVAVAGVAGGVGGRLDQGPAQVRRAVLGQWAALVAAAENLHRSKAWNPGADTGWTDRWSRLGDGKQSDVAKRAQL